MKQFLTLCLATAMLGSAANVDAKVSLKEMMQQKGNGFAIEMPAKLKNNGMKAIKNLKTNHASRFHKLKAEEKTGRMHSKKAPGKVLASGDNIFGYLGYTMGDSPYGLYEFNDGSQELKWADSLYDLYGIYASNLSLSDGVLKGYSVQMSIFGLSGVDYVEYDFESGEVLTNIPANLTSATFIQTAALNTNENVFYGYGAYEGNYAFMSAPADDPFNYTMIKAGSNTCFAICYNANEDLLIGVDSNFDLVRIDKSSGETTVLSHIDIPDLYPYLAGMVYDPASNLYYFNPQTSDDSSYLASINPATYEITILEEFPNSEQWMSFVTTDEEANPYKPGRPTAGAADFYKANLIGFVNFTLPTEMADGSEIVTNKDGKITYKTFVDGELYSVGTDVPGAEIRANFAVPEDGSYTFAMCVETTQEVDGEMQTSESAKASVKAYVGNDTPLTPTNVVLNADEVTWEPVTSAEGVHGGYVDVKAITYNVYLNGEPVNSNLTVTSCPVEIDKDGDLSAYNATVTAVANGHESSAASSNSIVEGAAMVLPYYIKPTPEQFEISQVIDENNDGASWQYVSYYMGGPAVYSDWSSSDDMDDWLFLPPVKLDDPTKFYTFSMDVALSWSYYNQEYLEVLLCTKDDSGNIQVVGTIVDEFSPESEEYEHISETFRVRQEGAYYIALHCLSEAVQDGIYAANFKVEDNNITLESPAAVEDLDLEAAEKGELKATATFTMPTATLGGAELEADANLVATLSCGDKQATVSGKPGEEISAVIETAQGTNTVNVTVALGDLNSPMASESVYTGVTAPATPTNLQSSVSADRMSITLTWDAVTEPDDEDGYINPETVVYDIYKVGQSIFGSQWLLYDEGITDTTYTYVADDQQDFVQLGVVARNEAGDNGYLVTSSEIVGPAYSLPIEENFDEGGFDTTPWMIYSFQDAPQISIALAASNTLGEYNGDQTCLVVSGEAGAMGQLGIPYFQTKGCKEVLLSIDVCGDFFLPKVTVLAEADGVETKEIGSIVQDEEGFHIVSVSLPDEFMEKDYVSLFLQFEFENGDETFAAESISILADGASVASLAGQSVKVMGGKNVINVSGLNGQNVTVADLNGRVVAKSAKVATSASFQVEKGIYVVEAGDKKAKVVVK